MSSHIVSLLTATGMTTPARRAVVFGITGFTFQYLLNPAISYDALGNTRDFVLFSSASEDDESYEDNSTYFPWFAWPLTFAVFGGLFL